MPMTAGSGSVHCQQSQAARLITRTALQTVPRGVNTPGPAGHFHARAACAPATRQDPACQLPAVFKGPGGGRPEPPSPAVADRALVGFAVVGERR